MLVLTALAAGTLTLLPAHAQTTDDDAHMQVTLADPALGGADGARARLDVELTATLTVAEDDNGPHVRLIMPHAHDEAVPLSPMDLSFFAPERNATDGTWTVETTNGTQSHAVFRWDRAAPPIGTIVPDVTLEAIRTVRLAETVVVTWPAHGFDDVDVDVDLPDSHEVVSRNLTPQVHNAPAARHLWTGNTSDPSVSLIIRPLGDIPDPRFDTYRPSPVTAWLIVIGLGVISGGAWMLGRRLDGPPDTDTEPDEHASGPPPDDPTRRAGATRVPAAPPPRPDRVDDNGDHADDDTVGPNADDDSTQERP